MVTVPRQTPVEVALPDYGVFVLESHHASGFRMEASAHDFLEIFYVVAGSGQFRLERRAERCRAGDVVVVPVGLRHQFEDDPGGPLSLYGICVAPRVWGHEPGLAGRLPAGRLGLSRPVVAQVRGDLRRLLFEQTLARVGSRSVILGRTLQLLTLLVRLGADPSRKGRGAGAGAGAGAGHREAVSRHAEELQRTFFEPGNIEEAAARLGMSRRHFTQLFREQTGTSWSDYVSALRVDYACRLLRETGRSVLAIAFECGYDELSSFYRAFKRRTGLPPSEWRHRRARG